MRKGIFLDFQKSELDNLSVFCFLFLVVLGDRKYPPYIQKKVRILLVLSVIVNPRISVLISSKNGRNVRIY